MNRVTARLALGVLATLGLGRESNAAGEAVLLSRFDASLADRKVDPCTDFYAYACSTWLGKNPIPADQSFWSTASNLQIWNETILKETMEQAAPPDPKRARLQQQIGDYWQACIDVANLDRLGQQPIRGDLDRIAAMKSKAELPKAVARLHLSVPGATGGYNAYDNYTPAVLFGFGPTQDFANAALVVAAIDQGGMGLPGRESYLSDEAKTKEVRQKYLAHVQKLFELAGEKPKQAAADAAAVLRIETALARAAMDVVQRRDPKNLNNVRSLDQVQAATPSFDWKTYLAEIGAPAPAHYIVAAPEFLTGMEKLIKSEPLSAWKAYLRWWTLHGNASALSTPFVEENFDFFGRVLFGSKELRPRWRRCVTFADRDLGEALGQAYVARAFPPESKQRTETMVHSIEAALGKDIDQLDWMSAATKKAAREKLTAIEEKFGYPKAWIDYSSVTIGRESLATNMHAASSFELHRQLKKIGKPVDRGEWTMTPPTINAYYDAQLNTINFPAGILQPPFFDPKQSEAANFGGIGSVIGHEIVHGFDDQGRKYDGQGNLRDWWTPEDGKKYDERGQCISAEYTQQVGDLGVKQDGLLTQGEDTADNGGVRIALMALEAAAAAQGKSLDVPGPDGFTDRQRFFVAYGFVWCANIRPEFARNIVTTNPHSLPQYRVNNVVQNLAEFQKAFGCKKGQPMVREPACRVW
jgi:putative endopeptidase